MSRTRLDMKPDIIWFAKPLGVAELLLQPEHVRAAKRDDWLRIMRQEGIDLFTGAGGRVAFATNEHEMIHRSFVCHSEDTRVQAKPGEFVERPERANMLGLFDFSNKLAPPLTPPNWAPHDASSCLVVDWNKSSALKSIGSVYDAFIDERGAFDRTMSDLKSDPDLRYDLVKLVAQLDHRSAVLWYPYKPGEAKTEHPVIGLKINGGTKFVMDSVRRATGGIPFEILGHAGIAVDGESEVASHAESDFPGNGEAA